MTAPRAQEPTSRTAAGLPFATTGRAGRRFRSNAVTFLAMVTTLTTVQPQPLGAQDASPPAEVADEFQRAFQSMVWEGMVQRLHPDALGEVRYAVDVVIDADSTGWALEHLVGGVPDRAAYRALRDDEVLVRAMRAVQREVPGLLSSLVSRRSSVLGTVMEGADTAHVVYRIRGLVQGSVSRVVTMTLERTAAGWKVRAAEELGVLRTALRGFPVPRQSPAAGTGAASGPASARSGASGRVTPG